MSERQISSVLPLHGKPSPPAPLSIDEAGPREWDRFVESHPRSVGYQLWGWRRVLERTFGHSGHNLIARRGDAICGGLPLVIMRSLIFGKFMSSLPYLDYGGLICDDEEAEKALLERAVEIARAERLRSIELRHVAAHPCPLAVRSHKVIMLLGLAADEDTMWKGFDSKLRNQIRKATKSGLECSIDAGGALHDFYPVFARNMRDLGTPVYPFKFFRNVRRKFHDRTHVLVVRKDGRPVAGAFLFRFRDRMMIPWASSIREFNSFCPNNLLYWEALRLAMRTGCREFDLGRSTPDEGTYKFKEQWGASPVAMHWQYWLEEGETMPDRTHKNKKFAAVIRIWQSLPLGITKVLGPVISRSLP